MNENIRTIWLVSSRWTEWDVALYLEEDDAYDALREFMQNSEDDGVNPIVPMFRQLRVSDFHWFCPSHPDVTFLPPYTDRAFCQKCRDEGYTGHLDVLDYHYNIIPEEL